MAEYRLYVEYPFRGSLEHDDKIEKAVGEGRIGSGAGMGFRDMEWIFEGADAKQQAEAALERVNALKIEGMTAKIWEEKKCPHGEPLGECDACDVAGDLAFDAAREDDMLGRR